jgi:NAD(P)-dependent dehydrogenase (short-subunit alcohol dehydrogenase family)
VALACATNGCTAIAVADRDQKSIQDTVSQIRETSRDVQVLELVVNVGDGEAVANMVAKTLEAFGRLDYGTHRVIISDTGAHRRIPTAFNVAGVSGHS